MGGNRSVCFIGFRGLRVSDERHQVGRLAWGCALLCALLLLTVGCASMNQKCSYYPSGIMESYRLRSTVVGTGETEMVSTDCAVAGYATRDTGLSDNGAEALETIAEGVVRGALVGAVP